jgi:hypothetical protein
MIKKIIKIFETKWLRAAGSSPAPPAVWVFWRLIWCTESLDRGLILVCRFSFVSSRVWIPVAAQICSCLQGWMHMRNAQLLLPNGLAILIVQGNIPRRNRNNLRVSFIIFRFHKDNKLE